MSKSKSRQCPPDEPLSFSHPRFWPTWLLIFFLRFLANRRQSTLIKAGRLFGKIGHRLAKRRRHITERNIALCFPELSEDEQAELVKQTMIDNVIGMLETVWAWYGDTSDMEQRLTIEGAENLKSALTLGRGVLLVGAHYTTLDLGGVMIKPVSPLSVIYARNKNPLLDKFIYDGRMRTLARAIDRYDMRAMVRSLRKGEVLWYSPDQDYGASRSVFAPFFGIQAASIKMTPKLATFNDSPVVIVSNHREPDDIHYRLRFSPALENYPSGDDVADATRINEALEKEIRRCPSQYMWVHRRFKTRPEGEDSVY